MKNFKSFVVEQSVEEGFFTDFFKQLIEKFTKACKAILKKLRPGGKVKIPFNVPKLMNEEFLIMGGYVGPILGNYAEAIAGVLFLDKMRERGFKIDEKSYKEILAKKAEYDRTTGNTVKTGLKADGKSKVSAKDLKTLKSEIPHTHKRADASAERMVNIIVEECEDSKFCRFGMHHSGTENIGKDTADVIVEKKNANNIKEEIGFSLKHYMCHGPEDKDMQHMEFKGTNKFAVGILAKVLGHDKVGAKDFHRVAEEVYAKFPKTKKLMQEFQKEYKIEQESWKRLAAEKEAIGEKHTLDQAKERFFEDRGGDKMPLEIQSVLYEQIIHEAIVERPNEVKEVILDMLDLRPNSPRIVAAVGYPDPAPSGKRPGGFFSGYNRYSKEVRQIINASLEDIDIQIISDIKPVSYKKNKKGEYTSSSDEIYRRFGRTQRIGSKLKIRFKIKGKDIPFEIGSQLYPNGQCQWSSDVFGNKNTEEVKLSTDKLIEK